MPNSCVTWGWKTAKMSVSVVGGAPAVTLLGSTLQTAMGAGVGLTTQQIALSSLVGAGIVLIPLTALVVASLKDSPNNDSQDSEQMNSQEDQTTGKRVQDLVVWSGSLLSGCLLSQAVGAMIVGTHSPAQLSFLLGSTVQGMGSIAAVTCLGLMVGKQVYAYCIKRSRDAHGNDIQELALLPGAPSGEFLIHPAPEEAITPQELRERLQASGSSLETIAAIPLTVEQLLKDASIGSIEMINKEPAQAASMSREDSSSPESRPRSRSR